MKMYSFMLLLLCSITVAAQNQFETNYSFIENKGQFNGRNWNTSDPVLFGYNHNPFYVFLSKNGMTYRFDKMIKNPKRKEQPEVLPKRVNISELVKTQWLNSNENVEIISSDKVSPYYSFAINGADGNVQNVNHVHGFQTITYKNLYDNIDVIYTIHPEGGIKYNVVLHPGSDPSVLQLKYESAHTNTLNENVNIQLSDKGQVHITTSLGQVIEHAPVSFYADDQSKQVNSSYLLKNNVLSFELGEYDTSRVLIIDPWIISPNFTTSSAVWEVETDAAGNVYSIGGEDPMELKKYNTAGALQWTYTTPWDSSNVWLGTLATDLNGNSYVTSGVTANMHKIDNNGNFVWATAPPGNLSFNSEWWSITFNCDQSKLIVGGTWVDGILSFDFYAGIFEIDVATGNVISDQTVDFTNIGGISIPPPTPVEVRSISSSKNAKYIFLSHQEVGAINDNLALCSNNEPIFQVPNQQELAYKCENYLPQTQNGGGLKALIANDNFFYTHSGNQIRQWDLNTGALLNTVALPGGAGNTVFGQTVVSCSGLDVDDCGNVYAGSTNQVVKFDPNLNVLSSAPTVFAVYDVDVNSNGEVIACGAQQNNSATNRNGRIESVALTACNQFALVCCDANFCNDNPFCDTDAPFTITSATPGGTWSGTGVNASGVFDPSIAGIGNHDITYTLPCGTETLTFVVEACNVLNVCQEANGDFTVLNGTGTITWEEEGSVSTPITNQSECENCGYTWFGFSCLDGFTTVTNCNTTGWVQFATGTTVTPTGNYPIQVTDGAGTSLIINTIGDVSACGANPCTNLTLNITSENDISCNGANDGSATVSATGGNGSYTYTWTPGALNGSSQSNLAPGSYTVNAIDTDGCAGSILVEITEPSAIVASGTATPATCGNNDGEITLTVNGGTPSYSFTWSNGATSQSITGLAPGAYSVTVTDQSGCTTTANDIVDALNGPTISIDNSNDVSCNGLADGSASVSATGGSGGYSYNWIPGNLTGASQSSLSAGSYDVTVTDSDGCPSTITIIIDEPASIDLTISSTPSSCSVDDGSASVSATGGTGGFTYAWSPVAGSTATLSNIGAGSYTVTVTDASACTEQATVNVSSVNGPVVTLDNSVDASCNGEADGSATVVVTGGTPGYTYSWTSGGTSTTESNLTAGLYTVTVTDNAGCISLLDISISEPAPIDINGVTVNETCAGNDGSIALTVTGGNGGYTYVWMPSGSGATATGLSAGNYTVDVTDANGCNTQSIFTLGLDNSILVEIVPDAPVIANGGQVTLNVTTTPPTSNPTYSWSPTIGLSCTDCASPIASPSATTTYIVSVTDGNGCSGSDTVTVLVDQPCGVATVPTIFSPNGDLNNDKLCVLGNCIAEFELSIYNRWGERVFESTSQNNCWDGTHRDKPINTGTFVYKLRVVDTDGNETIESGNITLVR
jgi:gliding motility-associated-like protein